MQRWLNLCGLTVLLVALVSPSDLRADAEPPEGVNAGKTDATHEKKDPNVFGEPSALIDLGIWTLVVFLLLLFVLNKAAWKPMLQGLQKREADIQGAKDSAEAASAEAAKLRAEREQELAKAREEAAKLREEARQIHSRAEAEGTKAGEANAAAMKERAVQEIETVKSQALHEIWRKAANLAVQASSKAIGRELTGDDHKRLIDQALAELKDAAKDGASA